MTAMVVALELPAVTWAGVGVGALALLLGGAVAWVVRRSVRRLLRWRGRSESSATVFARLSGWTVVLLAIAAALTIVFPSVRPVDILGGVGVVSIAAGIAFQTVLGNMFAGIVLLARDRFQVGDQIAVKDQRGTVVAMGLTSTSVRTFDGRLVLVPNGVLHSEIVTVQTGYEYVRTTVPVDLDEATDLRMACQVALTAMNSLPEVLEEPAPEALLSGFGTATVRLQLRFWSGARQLETREAQHAVIQAVLAAFHHDNVVTGSDVQVIEAAPGLREALSRRVERPPSDTSPHRADGKASAAGG